MPQPAPAHTHRSGCRLAPHSQLSSHQDNPPHALARFFYSAPSSIDDPLSSGDLSTASPEARSGKSQHRPFSAEDSCALEAAWLSLISDHDRRAHLEAKQARKTRLVLTAEYARRLSDIVRRLAIKHLGAHGPNYSLPDPTAQGLSLLDGPEPAISVCCQGLYRDVEAEIRQSFCTVARSRQDQLGLSNVVGKVMDEFKRPHLSTSSRVDLPTANSQSKVPESVNSAAAHSLGSSYSDHIEHPGTDPASESSPRQHPTLPATMTSRSLPTDDGISGKPFIRVGSPNSTPASRPCSSQKANVPGDYTGPQSGQRPAQTQHHLPAAQAPAEILERSQRRDLSVDVVVGVSRLHMVTLPALRMQPIYWSPVNDNAVAMRATWFYRDTMIPVPAEVANQLEAGYEELRPWTETWNDELKCAVEVGPLGEEKVSHRLWPDQTLEAGKYALENTGPGTPVDSFCAARCFRGEVASEGTLEQQPPALNKDGGPSNVAPKPFANYHVMYQGKSLAFLLKPSLKPSGYYGRRPLAKIMKGATVGVPVVRGFDEAAWNKYHHVNAPSKERQSGTSQPPSGMSGSGTTQLCPACEPDRMDVPVSDLILVIHGIGQKFAERVESFHFTHAINAFRRSINLELDDPTVKEILRDEGQTRIMALPINWRHSLSFEDGGPMSESDRASHAPDEFTLKDIEPPTIPAVRSMISDVMFDIPFYMSKHKPRMINALVAEANRVYRRWCQNNPGFSERGRVHLIAHSLGSAMALDILSHQPTYTPELDLSSPSVDIDRFEFNTTNLFLVGSPASFFLLLERATLVPRHGRMKPGAIPGDTTSKDVVAKAGTFGCLAVDNVYNILAKEDPISYLLNGTIDPAYSASLKTAYIPSTTTSLFQAVGSAFWSLVPGASTGHDPTAAQVKPTIPRLPSQLELEVHDFTREEIAEKKAYLLNDNGQIDYYLRSGGGPLEIQYLNMLGAHSSYWSHRDFVRMLCTEIGRKPGRNNTLPAMRAVKTAARRLTPTAQ